MRHDNFQKQLKHRTEDKYQRNLIWEEKHPLVKNNCELKKVE